MSRGFIQYEVCVLLVEGFCDHNLCLIAVEQTDDTQEAFATIFVREGNEQAAYPRSLFIY